MSVVYIKKKPTPHHRPETKAEEAVACIKKIAKCYII